MVDVVEHPVDGGEDLTTYVAPNPVTAPQLNVTAALDEATITDGTVLGASGTTVVVATGPVPSLLVPLTEIEYDVPFARPVIKHELPPLVLQLAFPGVAVAV